MIDLQQFCATPEDDPGRRYLHQPWSRGEHTYATNGHILVRVPRRADVPDNADAPDGERIVGAIDKMQMFPPPRVALPFVGVCPHCGETKSEGRRTGTLAGIPFNLRYLRMIWSLPGLQLSEATAEDPLWYTFDGGCGAIMPMRTTWSPNFEITQAKDKDQTALPLNEAAA